MSKSKISLFRMSNSGSQTERINQALKDLELFGIAAFLDIAAKKALNEHQTFHQFVESILEKEMSFRNENRVGRWTQQAKFPFIKTFKDFDFYSRNLEKINIPLVQEIRSCRFIDEKQNILFLGGTGLGKTHLSIATGIEAINLGKETRFFGLRELMNSVNKTRHDVEKERRLAANLLRPKLLIIDEMGLYNATKKFSDFIFRILIERYKEGASVIFTSNKDVGDWGPLFGDDARAAMIIDRILERYKAVIIKGKSYRIERKH